MPEKTLIKNLSDNLSSKIPDRYFTENFKSKVKILQSQFFSARLEVDLFNLIIYSDKVTDNISIIEKNNN